MVGFGAIAVLFGLFLPAAEIAAPIPIADNALIQHSQGWAAAFFVVLAVTLTADVLYRRRAKFGLLIPLLICGIVIAGNAYRFNKDMPFEPTNRFAARVVEQFGLTAGIGLWAVGLGGLLVSLAALITMFLGDQQE